MLDETARMLALVRKLALVQTGHVIIPQVWDLIIVGAGVAGAALAYKQGKVRSYCVRFAGKPVQGYELPTRSM